MLLQTSHTAHPPVPLLCSPQGVSPTCHTTRTCTYNLSAELKRHNVVLRSVHQTELAVRQKFTSLVIGIPTDYDDDTRQHQSNKRETLEHIRAQNFQPSPTRSSISGAAHAQHCTHQSPAALETIPSSFLIVPDITDHAQGDPMHICVKKAGATIAHRFVKPGDACRKHESGIQVGRRWEATWCSRIVLACMLLLYYIRCLSSAVPPIIITFWSIRLALFSALFSLDSACESFHRAVCTHHAVLLAHELPEEPAGLGLGLVLLAIR